MAKKLLAALLAAALMFSMTACNKDDGGKVNIPANQTGSEDFQKNMHQSTSDDIRFICETDGGIYMGGPNSRYYYIEKATKNITILCNKPECDHKDSTCNARLHAEAIWAAGDKLYYSNRDYVNVNGQYVNYGLRLYSVDFDGTNRRTIQKLQFEVGGETSSWEPHPIQHRGIVYFPYCGILYAMPLGGDIEKDAVAIWGEESEDAGPSFNLSAPRYTLWADGDTIYFMVNIPQTDGTYKDTLFAYDSEAGTVTQVWQVPDKDEVGEWVSTGVSVSQWYVMGGAIYFYLSGGDFWKTDLVTGETVKLADTHEKTKYGEAVFADGNLCLLNSAPEVEDGHQYGLAGSDYLGGDTIYVYGMDGNLIKELSLKSLYDKFDTLESYKLLFCSGGDIYLLADATTRTGEVGVGFTYNRNLTLCCVNIDTGEITQIYNWQ